jgi:hypothetical protein
LILAVTPEVLFWVGSSNSLATLARALAEHFQKFTPPPDFYPLQTAKSLGLVLLFRHITLY